MASSSNSRLLSPHQEPQEPGVSQSLKWLGMRPVPLPSSGWTLKFPEPPLWVTLSLFETDRGKGEGSRAGRVQTRT